MSAYRNDPRCRKTRHGWHVECGGEPVTVLYSATFGWGCYTGDDLVMVGSGFDTADDAIHALIGDPQEVAA